MGSFLSDDWKACAVPEKLRWIEPGSPISSVAASIRPTASPSAVPGVRLNEMVTEGNFRSKSPSSTNAARWRWAALVPLASKAKEENDTAKLIAEAHAAVQAASWKQV